MMQTTVIFVQSPPIFQISHVYFAINFVDTYVVLFSPAMGISVIKFRQYLPASQKAGSLFSCLIFSKKYKLRISSFVCVCVCVCVCPSLYCVYCLMFKFSPHHFFLELTQSHCNHRKVSIGSSVVDFSISWFSKQ